jgi:hypothetical protein
MILGGAHLRFTSQKKTLPQGEAKLKTTIMMHTEPLIRASGKGSLITLKRRWADVPQR